MARLFPNILFFIAGLTPTPEDIEAADALGPGAKFRNAKLIQADAPLEDCDGVAGGVDGDGNSVIPKSYAEAFPNADDHQAVRDNMMKRSPALAHMAGGDEPRPRESAKDREARIANARARGQQRAPVNERNADPVPPSMRTSQAGGPRVEQPTPPANDGWGTNPAELHNGDSNGNPDGTGNPTNLPPEGTNEPSGEGGEHEGQAAELGPQGAGGPGQRAEPEAPTSGAGNARATPQQPWQEPLPQQAPALQTSGAPMPRPGRPGRSK